MFNLEWYWWVLIIVAVFAIGYTKIVVGGKLLKKWNKPKPKSNQKD